MRDTSRVRVIIEAWCREHIGCVLPITNVKDFGMVELWDDRCVQVVPNTGEPAQPVCSACGALETPHRLLREPFPGENPAEDHFGTFWFCPTIGCRRGPTVLRGLEAFGTRLDTVP